MTVKRSSMLLVVLMRYIMDRTSVEEKYAVLLSRLQQSLGHNGEIAISASIGVSLCPTDGSSMEELYEKADQAMYHCKHKGKNGVCFAGNMQKERHNAGDSPGE